MHDIIKEIDPNVLRFFMISVQYRNPINYNRELVEAAASGLERIQSSYHQAKERIETSVGSGDTEMYQAVIDEKIAAFERHMDDDFNTANAITVWHDLATELNKYMRGTTTNKEVLESFIDAFDVLSGVLGVKLVQEKILLDEEVEALIEERNQARANRNFTRADEIRDSLKEQGIVLEDTKEGVRFKRG